MQRIPYYLVLVLASWFLRFPWLLGLVLVVWLLRDRLPSPTGILFGLRRAKSLQGLCDANPKNAEARRDLARLYLGQLRPAKALVLLDEALVRMPDEAELLLLRGIALFRLRRYEDALGPLVRAVEIDGRIGFGEPYLVAGNALSALGRWDEAVDAYERYLDRNGSAIGARVRLARALSKKGDRPGALRELAEAKATWGQVPAYFRRKEFRGYVGLQWARVAVAREPFAVAVLVVALGVSALATYRAGRWVEGDLRDRRGFFATKLGVRAFVGKAPPPSRFVVVKEGPETGPNVKSHHFGATLHPSHAACRFRAEWGEQLWFELRDTVTGGRLSVHMLGARYRDDAVGRAALAAFLDVVDDLPPVDCVIENEGGARWGVKGGRPFAEGNPFDSDD